MTRGRRTEEDGGEKPSSNAPSSSPNDTDFDLTISFAAGGWFQMYHFGVCKAFIDTGFLDKQRAAGKRLRFCGSSAGSLAAASLASGCNMHEEMRDFALQCADHYRESCWNFMCMREYLVASIHRFGDRLTATPESEEATFAALQGGQLEVYATTLPWLQRKCITTFDSLEDVEESLLASCCLTPVVGFPFPMRRTREWVCDGGFRSFQPRKNEPDTLCVSPFYFTSADIRPSTAIPVWWGLYPPSREEHRRLFDVGYNDALEYLVRRQLVDKEHITKLIATDTKLQSRRGGVAAMLLDGLIALSYVAMLKPLAILCIYLEMLLVGLALGVVALMQLVRYGPQNVSWKAVHDTLRNMVSLRQFLRLVFTRSGIPFNEARLSKRSRFYRAFQPLVFTESSVKATAETAAGGTRKRFIVGAHWNMFRKTHPLTGVPMADMPSASKKSSSILRKLATAMGNGSHHGNTPTPSPKQTPPLGPQDRTARKLL